MSSISTSTIIKAMFIPGYVENLVVESISCLENRGLAPLLMESALIDILDMQLIRKIVARSVLLTAGGIAGATYSREEGSMKKKISKTIAYVGIILTVLNIKALYEATRVCLQRC